MTIISMGYHHLAPNRFIILPMEEREARQWAFGRLGEKWAFSYPDGDRASLEDCGMKRLLLGDLASPEIPFFLKPNHNTEDRLFRLSDNSENKNGVVGCHSEGILHNLSPFLPVYPVYPEWEEPHPIGPADELVGILRNDLQELMKESVGVVMKCGGSVSWSKYSPFLVSWEEILENNLNRTAQILSLLGDS